MKLLIIQSWIDAREPADAGVMHFGAAIFVMVMVVGILFIGFANPSGAAVDSRVMRIAKAASGGFSDNALHAATAEMDPAMLALAHRYDPALLRPSHDMDLSAIGSDPFGQAMDGVAPDVAAVINAGLPFSTEPNPAAKPFSLKSAAELDRDRATDCLAQAVYYEAAFEPLDGQRAVAQVVINRMRHPAFPKTVCGVVYQGSDRLTGCQFSFTCDGALARAPVAWAWERARAVAVAALGGYVMKDVGGATHYHADYVAAYWAPRLFKVKQIGAHIFYRWPGAWGLPPAFNGQYAGLERPGIDLGGDPNRIALASLKLAGLEGVADAVTQAPTVVAALTTVAPNVQGKAADFIPEPVLAPEAKAEVITAPVQVVLPPIRPKAPPRLAMPD